MIVAVIGGKGGVGKTTVAYNLAAALEAVVVDADLGMADLPSAHGPDLHDVLAGRASPIEAVREETPVALLPCGRTLAGARATDPRKLVAAIEAVAAEYGRVVVDCPAGMGGDVGLALHAADACVLVTAPTEAALSDAVRARALARELDAGLVGIVLNRADGSVSRDLVARELGAPVTPIPPSQSLERAQRDGVPVTQVAPESTVAERLRSVANAVQSSLNSL
ncbi:MinD/ParA family protein [Halorientalis brevis]|uniref:MinD/ParA family protein n=1 Tax=Halorientalis brevis TaxID=1126241 RepID=A0ABD6C9P4_9EURY|nr:P-loop NTPase [Halorientalis brevis]